MRILQILVQGVLKTARACTWLILLLGLLLFFPRLFGITPYIVLSGSMEPAIPIGGVVFVNSRQNAYTVGDVITFQIGKTQVTHRIVRMEEEKLYTRGDANELEDPEPIGSTQILGKVCFALPWIGYAAAALQSPKGMLCLLILLLASGDVRKYERKRKKLSNQSGQNKEERRAGKDSRKKIYEVEKKSEKYPDYRHHSQRFTDRRNDGLPDRL